MLQCSNYQLEGRICSGSMPERGQELFMGPRARTNYISNDSKYKTDKYTGLAASWNLRKILSILFTKNK